MTLVTEKVCSLSAFLRGKICEKSDAHAAETTIVEGGMILTGKGCPEHEMLLACATFCRDVQVGDLGFEQEWEKHRHFGFGSGVVLTK